MAKRILLLEDNEDILEIIREVLIYEGFTLKSVTKAGEAISAAEAFQPDLMILDYRLQDGDGGQVARKFRTHPQFAKMPLIVCSAYLPPYEFEPDLFDGQINKPFNIDDLLTTVNRFWN